LDNIKTLFCYQTDIPLHDHTEEQISKLHFRVFCSFAISQKIDLTRITNFQSNKIEKQMLGDKWVSHAITQKILYHN
jgi:hypothetical protein